MNISLIVFLYSSEERQGKPYKKASMVGYSITENCR